MSNQRRTNPTHCKGANDLAYAIAWFCGELNHDERTQPKVQPDEHDGATLGWTCAQRSLGDDELLQPHGLPTADKKLSRLQAAPRGTTGDRGTFFRRHLSATAMRCGRPRATRRWRCPVAKGTSAQRRLEVGPR